MYKSKENELIWENFAVGVPTKDGEYEDDLYSSEEDHEQVVMTIDEPVGTMEVTEEPNDFIDEIEEDDSEMSELVMADIKKLDRITKKILDYAQSNQLEPWMQAKIVKAAVYVSDVWDQLDDEADFANDQGDVTL